MARWWSEQHATAVFARSGIRSDGHGVWHAGGCTVGFFVEHGIDTEPLGAALRNPTLVGAGLPAPRAAVPARDMVWVRLSDVRDHALVFPVCSQCKGQHEKSLLPDLR
ncbi:hypothetical protein EF879_07370 [Micromonospora sp. HM5-17]|nr:hypothetical protein EF879_07370 [Micromonospora sp. HM5-17]